KETKVTTLPSIVSDMQAAAAKAAGAAPGGEKDPIQEAVEQLRAMRSSMDRASMVDTIAEGIALAAARASGKAADAVYESSGVGAIRRGAGAVGEWIGEQLFPYPG